MFTNVGFVYTDVGFHLNSEFTKKLCTHIFPLGTQGLGIKELAEDSLYGLGGQAYPKRQVISQFFR